MLHARIVRFDVMATVAFFGKLGLELNGTEIGFGTKRGLTVFGFLRSSLSLSLVMQPRRRSLAPEKRIRNLFSGSLARMSHVHVRAREQRCRYERRYKATK